MKRGEVKQVKILGTIALIDEGETDWKIITIDVKDPNADKLNDIADVERLYPGLLKASVEWFKIYKIPDGKPENKFAFNGEAKGAEFATKVVEETHNFWQGLIHEQNKSEISRANVVVANSPYTISNDHADDILQKASNGGEAQPISDESKYLYILIFEHAILFNNQVLNFPTNS